MSAFNTQVNGTHYKDKAIQPIQLAYAVFGGDTCACKIAKYLTREKDDWITQIEKAEHVFQMFREIPSTCNPIANQPDYAQVLLLQLFIAQEPEPIHEDLVAIFFCSWFN